MSAGCKYIVSGVVSPMLNLYRRGLRVVCSIYSGMREPQVVERQQSSSTLFLCPIVKLFTKRTYILMQNSFPNTTKDRIYSLYNKFRNLILYGIIGGFCAALDFGIYTLLCYFNTMPYLWANIISVHCGIFCSFFLNRSINFKVTDKTTQRFMSFYIIGLIGLGISEGMLFLMVDIGQWNEIICKLITIVIVALVQFFLNKYITFKKTEK